jgi:hypothetical protein
MMSLSKPKVHFKLAMALLQFLPAKNPLKLENKIWHSRSESISSNLKPHLERNLI